MSAASWGGSQSDDDDSKTDLESNSRKRLRDSDEDNRKPAAKRSVPEDQTPVASCNCRNCFKLHEVECLFCRVNNRCVFCICDESGQVDSNRDTSGALKVIKEEFDGAPPTSPMKQSPWSCGYCETCTRPFVCGQCWRCSSSRRCIFSLCFNYDYKESALHAYKRQANLIKRSDMQLESQFDMLYGDKGALAIKLKNYEEPHDASSAAADRCEPRRLCGTCPSCTDSICCGKCRGCRGLRAGRCAFDPCLDYDYKESTLNKFRQEAMSAKIGDKRLEAQFEKLYGDEGKFPNTLESNSKHPCAKPSEKSQNGKRLGGLCGTCLSCTTPSTCGKCSACLGYRGGRCAFYPCLVFHYKESTLTQFRQEARSAKTVDKRLEDLFETLYGLNGHFPPEVQNRNGFQSAKSPENHQHNKRGRGGHCGTCPSCTTPMRCRKCTACHRNGRCIFAPCLDYDYKESTLSKYRQEASFVKTSDKRLEDQFETLYGENGAFPCKRKAIPCARSPAECQQGGITTKFDKKIVIPGRFKVQDKSIAKASQRGKAYACGHCSSCLSPISCKICYHCTTISCTNRCVFDICQNYTYKESRMVDYESRARKAIEISNDKRLKVRFEELFGKCVTEKKADGESAELQIGTRIFGRWPANDQWYYGTIVSKRRNLFDIQFDDGDELKGVTRGAFLTVKEIEDYDAMEDAAPTGDQTTATTHFLLKKGFHHSWINRDGDVKVAYGRIESFVVVNDEFTFTVSLDLSIGHWSAFGVGGKAPNPCISGMAEADAWAGYISFLNQTEGKRAILSDLCRFLPGTKPFYRHYLVPPIYDRSQQGTINLVVKGHTVQLKTKRSNIPNGGLGLFASAKPICSLDSSGNRNRPLVLEEGEMVDLGVYAPLRAEDLKSDHVLIVKNFVHNWKSENWSFDASSDKNVIFDITEDHNGELNELAEKNVVVYTNETNGNEIASVLAKEDPEGAVHYYLGHSELGQGCLSIPSNGEEVELKLDYGSKYESIRVRKGYSRLSGRQLEDEKKKASTYEQDMVKELLEFTAEEVLDAQIFLVKLKTKWVERGHFDDMGAVGRAMLATLLLFRRSMVINNATENVRMHVRLVRCLRELSLQFFDLFDYTTNRSHLLKKELYAELLATAIGMHVEVLATDTTDSIRKAIGLLQ